MLAVGRELIAQGAHAIIPLGGRLVPYVVSPLELEGELKVPVINTKLVGIRHAETLVNGKTSHSLQSYPWCRRPDTGKYFAARDGIAANALAHVPGESRGQLGIQKFL